jgi:hypothetical protein
MSTQPAIFPAPVAQPGSRRSAHSPKDFLWSNLIVRAIEGPARSRYAVTLSDDPFSRIVPLAGMNIPKAGQ